MSTSDGKSRSSRGAFAESLAVDYIEARGYRILERNYRCERGEIDIIALDNAILCFVEVRSFGHHDFGDPLETISRQKIARIGVAARDYISNVPEPWPEMRFDAVGIVLVDPPEIRLIKGAFEL